MNDITNDRALIVLRKVGERDTNIMMGYLIACSAFFRPGFRDLLLQNATIIIGSFVVRTLLFGNIKWMLS